MCTCPSVSPCSHLLWGCDRSELDSANKAGGDTHGALTIVSYSHYRVAAWSCGEDASALKSNDLGSDASSRPHHILVHLPHGIIMRIK